MARATGKDSKYMYDTIPKIEQALKIPEQEERLKRTFYPDMYYEENKEVLDERAEGMQAQKLFDEMMKNTH